MLPGNTQDIEEELSEIQRVNHTIICYATLGIIALLAFLYVCYQLLNFFPWDTISWDFENKLALRSIPSWSTSSGGASPESETPDHDMGEVSEYFLNSVPKLRETINSRDRAGSTLGAVAKFSEVVTNMQGNISDCKPYTCPFCWTVIEDKLEMASHIRLCTNGIPNGTIAEAIRLTTQQISDWKDIGLGFPGYTRTNLNDGGRCTPNSGFSPKFLDISSMSTQPCAQFTTLKVGDPCDHAEYSTNVTTAYRAAGRNVKLNRLSRTTQGVDDSLLAVSQVKLRQPERRANAPSVQPSRLWGLAAAAPTAIDDITLTNITSDGCAESVESVESEERAEYDVEAIYDSFLAQPMTQMECEQGEQQTGCVHENTCSRVLADISRRLQGVTDKDVRIITRDNRSVYCHSFLIFARCEKLLEHAHASQESMSHLESRNLIVDLSSFHSESVEAFVQLIYTGKSEQDLDARFREEVQLLSSQFELST